MSLDYDKAWFVRKGSGRGWALHKTWQGWALMLSAIGLAIVGRVLIESTDGYAGFFALLLVTFFGLCAWKGERSIWRDPKNRNLANQSPQPPRPTGG